MQTSSSPKTPSNNNKAMMKGEAKMESFPACMNGDATTNDSPGHSSPTLPARCSSPTLPARCSSPTHHPAPCYSSSPSSSSSAPPAHPPSTPTGSTHQAPSYSSPSSSSSAPPAHPSSTPTGSSSIAAPPTNSSNSSPQKSMGHEEDSKMQQDMSNKETKKRNRDFKEEHRETKRSKTSNKSKKSKKSKTTKKSNIPKQLYKQGSQHLIQKCVAGVKITEEFWGKERPHANTVNINNYGLQWTAVASCLNPDTGKPDNQIRGDNIAFLRKRGADAYHPDTDGRTPLHWAVFSKALYCTKALLVDVPFEHRKSTINAVDGQANKHALEHAVELGWIEGTKLLIKHGGCLNAAQNIKIRVNPNLIIDKEMLKLKAPIATQQLLRMRSAEGGDKAETSKTMFLTILEGMRYSNFIETDSTGETILHHAMRFCDGSLLKKIAEKSLKSEIELKNQHPDLWKPLMESKSNDDSTPLLVAVENLNFIGVRKLVENNVDITAKNRYNEGVQELLRKAYELTEKLANEDATGRYSDSEDENGENDGARENKPEEGIFPKLEQQTKMFQRSTQKNAEMQSLLKRRKSSHSKIEKLLSGTLPPLWTRLSESAEPVLPFRKDWDGRQTEESSSSSSSIQSPPPSNPSPPLPIPPSAEENARWVNEHPELYEVVTLEQLGHTVVNENVVDESVRKVYDEFVATQMNDLPTFANSVGTFTRINLKGKQPKGGDQKAMYQQFKKLAQEKTRPYVSIRRILDRSHYIGKAFDDQRGLFAARAIPSNTYFMEYKGLVHDGTSYKAVAMNSFMDSNLKISVDCPKEYSCTAAFMNDPRDFLHESDNKANVWSEEIIVDGHPRVFIRSRRSIKKGEEIFFDYGVLWWQTFTEKVAKTYVQELVDRRRKKQGDKMELS